MRTRSNRSDHGTAVGVTARHPTEWIPPGSNSPGTTLRLCPPPTRGARWEPGADEHAGAARPKAGSRGGEGDGSSLRRCPVRCWRWCCAARPTPGSLRAAWRRSRGRCSYGWRRCASMPRLLGSVLSAGCEYPGSAGAGRRDVAPGVDATDGDVGGEVAVDVGAVAVGAAPGPRTERRNQDPEPVRHPCGGGPCSAPFVP